MFSIFIQEKIISLIAPKFIERRDELEREANTDFLTGLGNRAAFEKAEPKARRDGLAFVIFDANNFGKVNKQCGHAQGDILLKQFSGVIGTVAKNFKARAFRYGGDEFVVVCSPRFAARVRDMTERLCRPKDFGNFVVSISGEVGTTVELADSRLQMRKTARKKVVSYFLTK